MGLNRWHAFLATIAITAILFIVEDLWFHSVKWAVRDFIIHALGGSYDDTRGWQHVFATAVTRLPVIVVPLGIFVLLQPRALGARETACRRCGYLLKGLREPKCPECGEAI